MIVGIDALLDKGLRLFSFNKSKPKKSSRN
jgi:hypothetical protein